MFWPARSRPISSRVLGADVIKIEDPNDPDQSRGGGTDKALNKANMGTSFLTQASNKRSMALDLKTGARPRRSSKLWSPPPTCSSRTTGPARSRRSGSATKTLAKINPRLIYASFSAFGQTGPRGRQTAYDHVIQATSGIMAMTGTKEVSPIKFGSPAVDYATGMTGAFALSAALFQRERTGRGQRIDMAMLDVAMILMASHVTGYLRNGVHPEAARQPPSARHQRRLHRQGRPAGDARRQQHPPAEAAVEAARPPRDGEEQQRRARRRPRVRGRRCWKQIMMSRTAAEWEEYLQANHVPAARVRTMGEAIADPQIAARGVIHRHMSGFGMDGPFSVPLAAFTFAHGGPRIDAPPPTLGQHNDEIIAELAQAQNQPKRAQG